MKNEGNLLLKVLLKKLNKVNRKSTCTILTCFSSIAALANSASTKGLENTEVWRAFSPSAGLGNFGLSLFVL